MVKWQCLFVPHVLVSMTHQTNSLEPLRYVKGCCSETTVEPNPPGYSNDHLFTKADNPCSGNTTLSTQREAVSELPQPVCNSRTQTVAEKSSVSQPDDYTEPEEERKTVGTVPNNAGRSNAMPRQGSWHHSLMTALLAGILAAQLFGFAKTGQSITKWQYKIEAPPDSLLRDDLEMWGDEGWEFVNARRATSTYGDSKYELIFRRPKE